MLFFDTLSLAAMFCSQSIENERTLRRRDSATKHEKKLRKNQLRVNLQRFVSKCEK